MLGCSNQPPRAGPLTWVADVCHCCWLPLLARPLRRLPQLFHVAVDRLDRLQGREGRRGQRVQLRGQAEARVRPGLGPTRGPAGADRPGMPQLQTICIYRLASVQCPVGGRLTAWQHARAEPQPQAACAGGPHLRLESAAAGDDIQPLQHHVNARRLLNMPRQHVASRRRRREHKLGQAGGCRALGGAGAQRAAAHSCRSSTGCLACRLQRCYTGRRAERGQQGTLGSARRHVWARAPAIGRPAVQQQPANRTC